MSPRESIAVRPDAARGDGAHQPTGNGTGGAAAARGRRRPGDKGDVSPVKGIAITAGTDPRNGAR